LLPDPVALDTSLLFPGQRLHAVAAAFADRIVESGVKVVTSELLEVELAEATFGIALRERWRRDWRRHRSDGSYARLGPLAWLLLRKQSCAAASWAPK